MSTISKNIFSSLFSSILQLYTGSVVFILLAKLMNVEEFGILSFGFSLASIVAVVSDFGFSLMIIKDYPLYKNKIKAYFYNSLLLKLCFAAITILLFSVYVFFLYESKWLYVGLVYIVFAVFSSFVTYLQALFKIQNRFDTFLRTGVVYAIFISLTVLLYWYFELSIYTLVLLFLSARFIQFSYCLFKSKFKWSNSIVHINSNFLKKIFTSSWSYGAHTILGILYFMVDTQIISIYFGGKEVALYQAVFRIILIFLVFSELITNVFLPYLSHKFYAEKDISEVSTKIFYYLLIIGLSLFLFFVTFKNFILTTLYSESYIEASIVVLPLSIVVVIRTVSSILGNLMTISNNQANRVVGVSVSLFLSVLLNFIFTPSYGIIAAAWINVFVHISLFFIYLYFVKREFPNIKVLTSDNLLLVMVSLLLYILVVYYKEGFIILISIFLWAVFIWFTMVRNRNFKFLKAILKENGIG